ncbi:MAG: toll/interleukin-1 receptor domain-containing protein [Pseudomonadales bacterium]|nr:toll/interleukin-1 receptor domain-containing protein [Pseudomonadales bacterium]
MKRLDPAKPYVFISYSRLDKAIALKFRQELEGFGIQTFMDIDLFSGAWWRYAIPKRVKLAGAVVVLWSENAIASDHVRSEADLVWGQDKAGAAKQNIELAEHIGRYSPILVGELENDALPMPFSQRNCYRYEELKFGEFVAELQYKLDCHSDDSPIAAGLTNAETDPHQDHDPHQHQHQHQANLSQPTTTDSSQFEAREQMLIRLINREKLLAETDRVIRDSTGNDSLIFLLEYLAADSLAAFADHVILRQRQGAVSISSQQPGHNLKALSVLAGSGPAHYHAMLQNAISRTSSNANANNGAQPNPEGSRLDTKADLAIEQKIAGLDEWMRSDPTIKVIYTVLDERSEPYLDGYIKSAQALIEGISENNRRHKRLVIIFGCIRETDAARANRQNLKIESTTNATWLASPGEISLAHFESWYQDIAQFDKYYDLEKIETGIDDALPEGTSLRYKSLKKHMLHSLKQARIL